MQEMWEHLAEIFIKIWLWEGKIWPSKFSILPCYTFWRFFFVVLVSILYVIFFFIDPRNFFFLIDHRNSMVSSITSKDFTFKIQTETISRVLFVIQPEIWNANS